MKMYPKIEEKKQEHNEALEKLKDMFLLNDEVFDNLSISVNDSEDKILEKFYEAEAKKAASIDASIKKSIDSLEYLDPTSESYEQQLEDKIQGLLKAIPQQNKNSITKYIARRKLVLDLFDKIMKKEIEKLKNGGRIDEDLLHNLIFQQHSDDPNDSDLWVINEEFIYFDGTSENQLGNVKIDGIKIIKEKLTEEEDAYRLKQQGDAKLRRTDILLFPKESKCIIIELKAPDVNISEHLNQINRYASLINNLSKDNFKFDTYYGYLIGENIDIDDIEDNDTDFISGHSLDFIYRPHKRIAGKFGKRDGALYTEIIKYSTLFERAKLRNKIFIDKLEGKNE